VNQPASRGKTTIRLFKFLHIELPVPVLFRELPRYLLHNNLPEIEFSLALPLHFLQQISESRTTLAVCPSPSPGTRRGY